MASPSKRFTTRAPPFRFFGVAGLGDSAAYGELEPSGVSGVIGDLAARLSSGLSSSAGAGVGRASEPSGESSVSAGSGSNSSSGSGGMGDDVPSGVLSDLRTKSSNPTTTVWSFVKSGMPTGSRTGSSFDLDGFGDVINVTG